MKNKNVIRIIKLIAFVIAIIICIGMIIYLFPVMKNLSTRDGQIAFKEKVEKSGFLGMLALFGLEVAQIFLFILPGEPIEIVAGMCYGGFWGTVFILVSAAMISTLIFFMVRKFGKDFVYEFCDKEKVRKIEQSKLFQNPKKIEMIMLILFLLPGTPKDLLTYIAGLLPIKPSRFIMISTLARIPSVISSTIAGEKVLAGQWKLAIALYAIIVLIAVIIIIIYNKFDKDKTTDEILKTIK